MPAPYTDTEQDALIDQLLADMATAQGDITQLQTDLVDLEARVTAIETTLSILEPAFATAQNDIADLKMDSTTHGANITALQGDVSTLQTDLADLTNRVEAVEGATVPAVDTLQDDVKVLAANSRKRQTNEPTQLAKPQIVTRPSIERVRRPDGKIAQRTVQPR